MKSSFERYIIVSSLLLLVLTFLLFGIELRALVFAALLVVTALLLSYRYRVGIRRPIRVLTEEALGATPGCLPKFSLRGHPELEPLASALTAWGQSSGSRIRDLSEARLFLESILRAMVEGVLVISADGRISLANDAVMRLLDIPRDPRGKTCLEVFRNESLDLAVRRVLGGAALDAVEFQTASDRTVRALLAPIVGDDGKTQAAVAVLHDMTDARQADRVQRDFVANVSHEFKTPLTSIRGYAETMMSETTNGSHREFLDVIVRNSNYLESLVSDVLALARIGAEPTSEAAAVNIESVINEQLTLRIRSEAARPMTFEVSCPSLEIRADRSRLSIALANLIDNAIRYNRPEGTVSVTGRNDGSAVAISVTDSGFGIPEPELSRIFERFYRVDKSRAKNRGGTGLGLAIAKHSIESLGGTLTVESKVGSGSTFTIRVPAEPKPTIPDRSAQ